MKVENKKYHRLLMPLSVPMAVWENVNMDFIMRLPKVKNITIIVFIVDRLTKYYHMDTLHNLYSATTIAEFFVNNVIKLHGLPRSIILDHYNIFTRKF